MPVCIALNLVCFGIEPGVLQRGEFCLYLTVQVDEGSLFCKAGGVALVGSK